MKGPGLKGHNGPTCYVTRTLSDLVLTTPSPFKPSEDSTSLKKYHAQRNSILIFSFIDRRISMRPVLLSLSTSHIRTKGLDKRPSNRKGKNGTSKKGVKKID